MRNGADVLAKRSSLTRAFGWTFLGRVIYGASQWGILSVLAKLGDVELVGQFALAFAIAAPLSVFANLQLRSMYATDVDNEFSWRTYLRLRIQLSLACFVALSAFALLAPSVRDSAVTIVVVAAAKGVEMLSDLCHGVFQRHRAMHHLGQSLALRGVGGLTVVAATIASGWSLDAALTAMLVVWILVVCFHDWPIATALRVPVVRPRRHASSARLLWLALPMGAVMLLDSLNQNVPRYLLEAFSGGAELGIYVAMAYVIAVGASVVFALGAPLAAAMARDYAARRRDAFVRRALGLLAMTVALGVGGVGFAMVFGRVFLRLAYSAEFAESAPIFVWVMAGAAFHYVILMCNNVLTSARLLRVQLLVWATALLVTTIAASMWVPTGGVLGAAQSFVVGVGAGAAVAVAAVVIAVRMMPRGASNP